MAKAKSTKVENLQENPTNQVELKKEVVVKEIQEVNYNNNKEEEDNTPEKINNIVKEEIKENTTQEVKQFTPIQNRNKVRRIIQKRPSHYSLLMEDGRQLVVHKSIFDRERMIVLQD